MATSSTDLILFAINTAVKLGGAARKHYVASTQSTTMTFPLPAGTATPDTSSALAFFKESHTDGKNYLSKSCLLRDKILPNIEKTNRQILAILSSEEKDRLLAQYFNYSAIDKAKEIPLIEQEQISALELETLFQISQWQDGDSPHPTLLMRIAGNLVDVTVDYFLQVPDAFNKEGKNGKVVQAVLKGLDKVDFSQELEPGNIKDLPQRLLIVALETVSENSKLVPTEPRFQTLIEIATSSLVIDINARNKEINDDTSLDAVTRNQKKTQTIKWGEFVFRSVLASAGRAMVSEPQKFLKQTDSAQQDLTTTVAGALLDAILSDDSNGILQSAFNEKTLESVMLASFEVLGRHPDLIVSDKEKHKKALTAIISATADELGQQAQRYGDDMLASIVRLIFKNTGENLELFWPNIENHPEKHLLIKVSQEVINALSNTPNEGDKWRPKFTRQNVEQLLQFILEDVVKYPNWLLDSAGNINNNLSIALGAIIASLRKMDRPMLSTTNAKELIETGLKAVILDQSLLKKLQSQKVQIAAIFDLVFDEISGTPEQQAILAQWQNVRSEFITEFISQLLAEIVKKEVNEARIALARTTLTDSLLAQTKLDLQQLINSIGNALALA